MGWLISSRNRANFSVEHRRSQQTLLRQFGKICHSPLAIGFAARSIPYFTRIEVHVDADKSARNRCDKALKLINREWATEAENRIRSK